MKMLLLSALMLLQGPTIPAPTGMVSDFAGVVTPERERAIERIAQFVRAQSGGEIAVVTLADLAGRDVGDVALRIGREWGVGAKANVGDRARNAGVVLLVVPKETSADGRGYISIQTGQGTEGFITDATAGDIRREAIPLLQAQDYGGAMELMTFRIAERFAAEFGFSMDSVGVAAPPQREESGGGNGAFIIVFLIFFVLLPMLNARGRRGGRGLYIPPVIIGGGGFGGFGGGGGGGGFGGFGGGGGFSGGGSSGSW
jgi:uncharacterized protein